MSEQTQHVLDAIDGALLDYSVSGDAMRWTPKQPPKLSRTGLFQSTRQPLTVYVAPLNTPAPINPEAVGRAIRLMGDGFTEAIQSAVAALTRMGEVMRDAGISVERLNEMLDQDDESPSTEARARALWLRQHRNTGPDRDLTKQRRPRTAL